MRFRLSVPAAVETVSGKLENSELDIMRGVESWRRHRDK